LNILYVITRGDSIGGAQTHLLDFARGHVAARHQMTTVIGTRGPLFDELTALGVPTIELPSLKKEIHPLADARAIRDLVRVIKRVQPDVVSCHSSKSGIVGRIAARICKVPCVFTAHGWAFTEGVPQPGRFLYRWIERSLAPLAARIICVSEHDRQLALAAGIDPRRLVTVHNCMPDIPPDLRAQPRQDGPLRLTMVARFDLQKDHSTLLQAVAQVEDVHVNLVGSGPTMEIHRLLARHLGIERRVSFLGTRRDVAQILAASDAFALISNWEGFPRSTLEAMRAGLPVIVSDVGGAAEAVEPGITGFVVPPGDVAAVAHAIHQLARDEDLRLRMSKAARKRYQDEFTFDRMYHETVDVLSASVPRLLDSPGNGVSASRLGERRPALDGGTTHGN